MIHHRDICIRRFVNFIEVKEKSVSLMEGFTISLITQICSNQNIKEVKSF